jgi:hypothetical protein
VRATSPSHTISPGGQRGGGELVELTQPLAPIDASPVVTCPVAVGASVEPVVGAGADVEVGSGADVEPTISVVLPAAVEVAAGESSPHACAPRIATPPPTSTRPIRIAETVSLPRFGWRTADRGAKTGPARRADGRAN